MLEFPGCLCFMRAQLLEFPVWALKKLEFPGCLYLGRLKVLISRTFVLQAPKDADICACGA